LKRFDVHDRKLEERVEVLEREVEALKKLLWKSVRAFAVRAEDEELWKWWEQERQAREGSGR